MTALITFLQNKYRSARRGKNSFWSLLRMGLICLQGSANILIHLYKNSENNRAFINHEIRRRATQILQLARIRPEISIEQGFKLDDKIPCIYMSNHASLLDIPLIYHLLPGTIRFIAKQTLFEIPVFGRAIAKAEILSVGDKNLFIHIKQLIQTGGSIWLFPEGQRSLDGSLLPFKAGGFSLAREIGAAIIPVAICGTREALPKGSFSLKPGAPVSMRVGRPIDSTAYSRIEQQSQLMCDVRSTIFALMN